MGKFSLTETENEVMEFFWNNEGKFAFGEIYDYFTKEKNKTWKKQTVQTFITHLIQKGALANEKDEYMQKWTENFLDETFDGSIKKFLSTLSGGNGLDEKTVTELREFLNNDEG